MSNFPSSIALGPLNIHLYGLIISIGIIAGTKVSIWCISTLSKKKRGKLNSDTIWAGVMWGLVGGVIGARAYHVIDQWSWYSQHIGQIPAIWQGGLGIFGGLLGGAIAVALFTKKYKLNIYKSLDVAALGVPLGQAIGRFGNFVNQELYGFPSQAPWAIYIAPEHRPVGYEFYTHFHPLFIYESFAMLVVFVMLQYLFHYQKVEFGTGRFAALFLISYSFIRFCLESLRLNPWQLGGIPTAQIISALIMSLSLWWLAFGGKQLRA